MGEIHHAKVFALDVDPTAISEVGQMQQPDLWHFGGGFLGTLGKGNLIYFECTSLYGD